jgi:Mg2+ and Co2+ transporter CorA
MHSDALMYLMLGLCVVIPVGMIVWFKRKDWL